MLIRYCCLASGSKGNAIFVETTESRFLIDAGLSARALAQRLAAIGVELDEIDAILITHEHSDHIRGLKMLALRHGIPVYANAETAKAIVSHLGGECPKFKIFSTGERFEIAGLTVHPFSISHDAADPVAFVLECKEAKLGVCTDLGFVTSLVRQSLVGCTHLVLESNHQPSMVHASSRPQILKQRILGRTGHISNEEAGTLLTELHHDGMAQVHLAHLSEECNHPQRALETVTEILDRAQKRIAVEVAPQHEIATQILI